MLRRSAAADTRALGVSVRTRTRRHGESGNWAERDVGTGRPSGFWAGSGAGLLGRGEKGVAGQAERKQAGWGWVRF